MITVEEYRGITYERYINNRWGDSVKLATADLQKMKNYIAYLERVIESLKENNFERTIAALKENAG